MPNVVRFALDSARTLYVPGAGLFIEGILDIDANNVAAVAKARFRVQPYRATEIGIVDSATPLPTLPAGPEDVLPPNQNPYPQYLEPSELIAAMAEVVAGTNAFTVAQRAIFIAAMQAAIEDGDIQAGLSSPTVRRIITSTDPNEPLEDGDLLVVLPVPPVQLFTNFAEYTLNQKPADWSTRWNTGGWSVVADAGGSGGVVLRDTGSATQLRGLSWDVLADVTDAEIVFRWRTSNAAGPVRGVHRGAGSSSATQSGYHAGAQNATTRSIQKAINSATSTTLASAAVATSTNTWMVTRVRCVGGHLSSRTWVAASTEPTTWDLEVDDTSLTSGWLGLRIFAVGVTCDIDWFGVGLGTSTAPTAPVA